MINLNLQKLASSCHWLDPVWDITVLTDLQMTEVWKTLTKFSQYYVCMPTPARFMNLCTNCEDLEFVQVVVFENIILSKNNSTEYLSIFNESCEM